MNRPASLERWATPFLIALTSAIYVGSAGIPALLDDADSLFAEVGREMNARHDWITPYTNSIRFLEKPPMFYWLTSISYGVFRSATAFTARLPTALAVVALVLVTYQIGKLVFGWRAGFFGGLALATSAGTFLFTRIVLPDPNSDAVAGRCCSMPSCAGSGPESKTAPLVWMYVFAALAVLTKGLIGAVFPAAIVFFTLLATGTLKDARQLVSAKGLLIFFVISIPWHVLAGLRNPGFFWFYFINEHLLRFIGGRYPMNYPTMPLVPFWLLHLVWLFPWSMYLLAWFRPDQVKRAMAGSGRGFVLLVTWALTVLIFFLVGDVTPRVLHTILIFPALALLAGAQCADCWERGRKWPGVALASLGVLIAVTSMIVLAASATPGAAESFLKLKDNPQLYVFYLGHLFDLTPASLLALRAPLLLAVLSLGVALPLHQWVNKPEAKGVVLALGMALFFVAADIAFLIFAPRMTSRVLAEEINRRSHDAPTIVIDGGVRGRVEPDLLYPSDEC